jgi:hypothetical protein
MLASKPVNMPSRTLANFLQIALLGAALFLPLSLAAEQIPVRQREGVQHGFLVLRSVETGEALAEGELLQDTRGDVVTSELVFHFKDGSLHDETAVFSQRGKFRLISDHLIQKGPSFKHPTEMTVDGKSGQVTIHSTDDDGKEKTYTDKMSLPPDVANGFTLTLLKNLTGEAGAELSMVASTPKPRLVKLKVTAGGEDSFTTAGATRKAMHYVVKIELGGITGLVAPLFGKEPPDIHVWVLRGKAPAFVKSEGPLYAGGPIWRIELTSPVWPKERAAK